MDSCEDRLLDVPAMASAETASFRILCNVDFFTSKSADLVVGATAYSNGPLDKGEVSIISSSPSPIAMVSPAMSPSVSESEKTPTEVSLLLDAYRTRCGLGDRVLG